MADFLPSRSVLSVCFPGCVLTSGEAEQQRKSKEIDKCLSREKTYVKRLVKILLLGAGESGKSTFLKQMRIIHGQDFDQRAREEFRPTIYSNVIKGGGPGSGRPRRPGGPGGGAGHRPPLRSPRPGAREGGAARGPPPRLWPRPPPEGGTPGCRLASPPGRASPPRARALPAQPRAPGGGWPSHMGSGLLPAPGPRSSGTLCPRLRSRAKGDRLLARWGHGCETRGCPVCSAAVRKAHHAVGLKKF